MAKSNEAFWWSLFSGGGVMAALFVPGLILATGFVIPMSVGDEPQVAYERLSRTLAFWPVRAVLFVVIVLSAFHCAHRVRHTLMDLGLRRYEGLLMTVCYTAALVLGAITGILLVGM